MIKHHDIVLYVSSTSHMSQLAADYFRQNGFDFEEINVDKDKAAGDEVFNRTKGRETPVAEIDGRIVTGYRPDVYEILLGDRDAASTAE